MSHQLYIEIITAGDLISKVASKKANGCRLVQICATTLAAAWELTYSFDLDGLLTHLRLEVPFGDPRIPSVSGIYPCAFLYENEMNDLFGLKVEGMTVDFHGSFYNTSVKHAFGPKAPAAPALTRLAD